jgi:flagellar basal body-associated protein FliL
MSNISKKDKITIIMILIVMLFIIVYNIYYLIYILKYREGRPEDIIYISNASNNTNYKVYLIKNDFIEYDYLLSGFSYPTSLIKYLNINFNYKYKGDNQVPINYQYKITANIISEFAGNKTTNNVTNPIWLKDFILLDNTNGSSNNSTIDISTEENIDLNYYNQLVGNYRQTLNIPIISRLEIKFQININGIIENHKNQPFTKDHSIVLTIPLDVKAFDILMNNNFIEKEKIYDKDQPTVKNAYIVSIILILLIIGTIILGFYLIMKLYNKKKSNERIMLEKILREYNNRIITIASQVKFADLEIIEISSFNELLNLSDEILEPIIYWNKKTSIQNIAYFSIIRGKIMYRYILKYK